MQTDKLRRSAVLPMAGHGRSCVQCGRLIAAFVRDCTGDGIHTEARPTTTDVFVAVRALGLSVRRRQGEWRIAIKGSTCRPCLDGREADCLGTAQGCSEAAAYYTNDNRDAIETARHLATWQVGRRPEDWQKHRTTDTPDANDADAGE